MARTSLAAILVREVADQCREHGDRTFAYGIGGLLLVTVGLIIAPALRIAGVLCPAPAASSTLTP
ncbi:hypothetical protein [Methylobacterium komagatae]